MNTTLILGVVILVDIVIYFIVNKKLNEQSNKIIKLAKENRFLKLKYQHNKVHRIECPYNHTDIRTLDEDCGKYFKPCDGCVEGRITDDSNN